jgi:fluoroquinolone resistance protein
MPETYINSKTFEKTNFTENPLTYNELEDCIFRNCNFADADLSNIIFVDCEFVGCNLSLANL